MNRAEQGRAGFTRYAWVVLGYTLFVIVWGYILRISESGDGCGTDWPLCQGQLIPGAGGSATGGVGAGPGGVPLPTWVEYIHRVTSGVTLLLAAGLYLWAAKLLPVGNRVRRAAGGVLLFTLSESFFGALLVVFGLVAEDISAARIAIRPVHVTNNFLLMASLALTAWWATRGAGAATAAGRALAPEGPSASAAGSAGPLSRLAGGRIWWPPLIAVLLLAASGSWTGLASTAFPAESVAEGVGQYLAPDHLLIYLRVIHPLVAFGAVFALVRLVARGWAASRGCATPGGGAAGPDARRAEPWPGRLAVAVGALTAVQLAVGPLTILLLQPPALRVFHLFVADLLWISVVLLSATLAELTPE